MRPLPLPSSDGQLYILLTAEPTLLLGAGSQIRDNFLILGPCGVLFGWMCRAVPAGPFLEALQSSSLGALNIDACRKPWTSEAERLSALPKSMPSANGSLGTFETRDRSQESPEDFQSPLGRWPTNVVLVHDLECGEACVEACVVARLDRQSGLLQSGVGAVKQTTAKGHKGSAYGRESRPVGSPMIAYGDIGGASRYYPQFRSYAELLTWLEQLVQAPPQIESLTAARYSTSRESTLR